MKIGSDIFGKAMLVLLLILSAYEGVFADNTLCLSECTGAPGDRVSVDLWLQNSDPISGIALALAFDDSALNFVECVPVEAPFEIFANEVLAGARFVLIDPHAGTALPAGRHHLAILTFDIEPGVGRANLSLHIQDISLTDGSYPPEPLVGSASNGVIRATPDRLTPVDFVWGSRDSAEAVLRLDSAVEIAGLQFLLKWTGFDACAWSLMPPVAGWQAAVTLHGEGVSRFVLADLQGNQPLAAGRTDLVYIRFSGVTMEAEDQDPTVFLDSLMISNTEGQSVPINVGEVELEMALRPQEEDPVDKLQTPVPNDDVPDSEQDAAAPSPPSQEASDVLPDQGVMSPEIEGPGPSDGQGTPTGVQIAEILADPPTGLNGDANGDGVRDSREDEFVELVNRGVGMADLSGWILGDDDVAQDQWFQFENGVSLAPGERLVVFGGGHPAGIPGQVFVDDGAIGNGLTNSGDHLFLIDPQTERIIDQVAYGDMGNRNQSMVREGDRWVLHGEGIGRHRFSPGRERPVMDVFFPSPAKSVLHLGAATDFRARVQYTDGFDELLPKGASHWLSSDPEILSISPEGHAMGVSLGDVEVWFASHGRESLHGVVSVVPDVNGEEARAGLVSERLDLAQYDGLAISEVHPAPGAGDVGDTNGDGVRDSYADEFIELVNQGETPVDLGLCYIGDDDVSIDRLFRFPDHVVLAPGAYLVLFGGGIPKIDGYPFVVDDGRIGDGLSNAGDGVLLLAPDGVTQLDHAELGKSTPGVSWVRAGAGTWAPHNDLPGKGDMSPGMPRSMLEELRIPAKEIEMKLGARFPLRVLGRFTDGDTASVLREITPVFNPGSIAELVDGFVRGRAPGVASLRVTWRDFVSNELRVVVVDTLGSKADEKGEESAWEEPPEEGPVKEETVDGEAQEPAQAEPADETQVAGRETAWELPEGFRVSEIHPNPAPGGAGDMNGDGLRNTFEDEFVEFENLGTSVVDLGGWRFGDDDTAIDAMFVFPSGTLLPPGETLVLFGGGTPAQSKGRVLAGNGRLGDGLANGGDCIRLIAPDGSKAVLSLDYSDTGSGISWVPRDDGVLVRHDGLPFVGKASPGLPNPMLIGLRIEPSEVVLMPGDSFRPKVFGRFNDDTEHLVTEEITWSIPDGMALRNRSDDFRFSGADTVSLYAQWAHLESPPCRVIPGVPPPGANEPQRDSLVVVDRDPVQANTTQPYRQPEFLTQADTIALVGLPYTYRPEATDGLGNLLDVKVMRKPVWLNVLDGSLAGIPGPEDSGGCLVELAVTDGVTEATQLVLINVRAPSEILSKIQANDFQQDEATVISISLPEGVQVQVDGGPEWDPESRELIWQPGAPGPYTLLLSFSMGAVSEVRTLSVVVGPSENLIATGNDEVQGVSDSVAVIEQVEAHSDGDGSHDLEDQAPSRSFRAAPNPFNNSTLLEFRSHGGYVNITVYSILGQPVRRLVDQMMPVGFHQRVWDGTDDRGQPVGTGVYLVRVEDRQTVSTRRVALLR